MYGLKPTRIDVEEYINFVIFFAEGPNYNISLDITQSYDELNHIESALTVALIASTRNVLGKSNIDDPFVIGG